MGLVRTILACGCVCLPPTKTQSAFGSSVLFSQPAQGSPRDPGFLLPINESNALSSVATILFRRLASDFSSLKALGSSFTIRSNGGVIRIPAIH